MSQSYIYIYIYINIMYSPITLHIIEFGLDFNWRKKIFFILLKRKHLKLKQPHQSATLYHVKQ